MFPRIHARVLDDQRVEQRIVHPRKRGDILDEERQALAKAMEFSADILKDIAEIPRLDPRAALNHVIHEAVHIGSCMPGFLSPALIHHQCLHHAQGLCIRPRSFNILTQIHWQDKILGHKLRDRLPIDSGICGYLGIDARNRSILRHEMRPHNIIREKPRQALLFNPVEANITTAVIVLYFIDKVMIDAPLELLLILGHDSLCQAIICLPVRDLLHLRHREQLPYSSLQCIVTAAHEENDLILGHLRAKTRLEPTDQMRFPRTALPVHGDKLMPVLRIPHEFLIDGLLRTLRAPRRREFKFIE